MNLDEMGQMLSNQNELQLGSYGIDIAGMNRAERIAYIKEMKMALDAELQEMLDEMGWKPWASSDHLRAPEATGEMVDAWHFFMNILIALGCELGASPYEMGRSFAQKYYAKSRVNAERMEQGYDGVSSKCASCHREVTELPGTCFIDWICTCGDRLTGDHRRLIESHYARRAEQAATE